MQNYFKFLSLKSVFFLLIHLTSFLIKIQTGRWLVTTITEYEKIDDLQYKLILWIFFSLFVNITNRYSNYLIKDNINTLINNYYIGFFEKLQKEKYTNIDKKELNITYDNLSKIDKILERFVMVLPKNFIYLGFYLYSLLNFSLTTTIIVILFNSIGIYASTKINKMKKKNHDEIYNNDIIIKNKHLERISTNKINFDQIKEEQNIKKKLKLKELLLNHFSSIFTEFFSDLMTLLIILIGLNYYNSSDLKPIQLLYLGINSGNFIIYSTEIKDNIEDINREEKQIEYIINQ